VDIEEGEISSEEETTDKATSSSVKPKSKAMDKIGKIKFKRFYSPIVPSKNVSSYPVCCS